jgi:hypothetical protein
VSRYSFGPSPNNLRILARRLRMGQLYSPPIRRVSNLRRNLGAGPGVKGSHARRSDYAPRSGLGLKPRRGSLPSSR